MAGADQLKMVFGSFLDHGNTVIETGDQRETLSQGDLQNAQALCAATPDAAKEAHAAWAVALNAAEIQDADNARRLGNACVAGVADGEALLARSKGRLA